MNTGDLLGRPDKILDRVTCDGLVLHPAGEGRVEVVLVVTLSRFKAPRYQKRFMSTKL